MKTCSNWVLIGMPGAGKSTVGVLLAKQSARDFIDTDVLIQVREGRSLQQILDAEGYLALRAIEERELLALSVRQHVIATGGSAAYSEAAMRHLKGDGLIVYLHADVETLRGRIHDFATRGLARRPDQSFEALYAERLRLYRRYADLTVDCAALDQDEVCERIIEQIRERQGFHDAGK